MNCKIRKMTIIIIRTSSSTVKKLLITFFFQTVEKRHLFLQTVKEFMDNWQPSQPVTTKPDGTHTPEVYSTECSDCVQSLWLWCIKISQNNRVKCRQKDLLMNTCLTLNKTCISWRTIVSINLHLLHENIAHKNLHMHMKCNHMHFYSEIYSYNEYPLWNTILF